MVGILWQICFQNWVGMELLSYILALIITAKDQKWLLLFLEHNALKIEYKIFFF